MFSIYQQFDLKTTLTIQKAAQTNVHGDKRRGESDPLGSQLADEARTDEFHTCFRANKLQLGGGAV